MQESPIRYEDLIGSAREALERFAPGLWTDFNAHDPGITALEYLAEALADCSYRIGLPVADLIASGPGGAPLPSPPDLLATVPVTDGDVRALLIDIPEVRNAWIIGKTGGLLQVAIDTVRPLGPAEQSWLRRDARERLVRQRLVGTDIGEIALAKRGLIGASVTVAAGRDADTEASATAVTLALDAILMNLPAYRIDERAGENAVASGPAVNRGIFDTTSMAASNLQAQVDLASIADQIEKELADLQVRDLFLWRKDDAGTTVEAAGGMLQLEEHCAYMLDTGDMALSVLVNGRQVKPDLNRLVKAIEQGRAPRARLYPGDDEAIDHGTQRTDLASYPSVQRDFPALYGLKRGSLSPKASDTRQAQAKQLQAFLLMLEQPVADLLARLSGSAALLGLTSADRSIAAGTVEFDHLHKGLENAPAALTAASRDDLAASAETARLHRGWGRFTAALVAKDDLPSPAGLPSADLASLAHQPLAGWNYLEPPTTPGRLTPFERLAAGLCLRPHDDGPPLKDRLTIIADDAEYRFRLDQGGDALPLLSRDCFSDPASTEAAAAVAGLSLPLRDRYRIETRRASGTPGYRVSLIDESGATLAHSTLAFDSRAAAEKAIEASVRNAEPEGGSGIYLVEHLLLRPADAGGKALSPAFCHQVTLVVPAAPERWQPQADLTTLDWLVAEALPAHLLVNILPLPAADLIAFEEAYFAWLDDFWGGGPALGHTRLGVIAELGRHGIGGWAEIERKEVPDAEEN
ncbi:hypothetical protein [Gimibacter soli]|uniref:Uncharacterized protein n=1 Tax=Gimibacter soli TaxID=3024400 RepID=A0AAF0BGG1_9PROT|nr:hypothetical protein [Gimibacter soli]WCL53458.1 hypothetical protein PH603_13005 [Gimibacter soli]